MITRDYILARITEIEQERDAFHQDAERRDAVYSGGLAALRQLLATIDEAAGGESTAPEIRPES